MAMNIQLTPDVAQQFLVVITSLLVPFVTSYAKQVDWPDWVKFTLAAAICLIGGFLDAFIQYAASGKQIETANVLELSLAILFLAQAHYHTWFKGFEIEARMNPAHTDTEQASTPPAGTSHPEDQQPAPQE